MKWSWRLVRFAGIDVYVHATFLILLFWIGISYWNIGQSWQSVVTGVGFILALFGCVVLHEFGHALTARRFGIGTKNITLLPIGGVATLERMPEDPKQEIAVALAGPAVNFGIAIIIWVWMSLNGIPFQGAQLDQIHGPFLERLLAVNIILAVFNLIPAFPMDGGRVLRAVLALQMDHNQATQIAAKVGQGLALFFGLIGLLYNPFLVFIALFIWIGATMESGVEQLKSMLSGSIAKQAMLTDFQVLSATAPLSQAVKLTLAGSQIDFPVLANGKLVGVLSQSDLLRGLNHEGEQALVRRYMQDVLSCAKKEPLEKVLEKLLSSPIKTLGVMEKGELIGIINLENIMEYVNIRSVKMARAKKAETNQKI